MSVFYSISLACCLIETIYIHWSLSTDVCVCSHQIRQLNPLHYHWTSSGLIPDTFQAIFPSYKSGKLSSSYSNSQSVLKLIWNLIALSFSLETLLISFQCNCDKLVFFTISLVDNGSEKCTWPPNVLLILISGMF